MASGDKDGDEEDLFRRALADAQPLKRRRPQPAKPAARTTAARAPKKKKPASAPVSPSRPAIRPPPPPALAAGDYAAVDRRTADRFRRGKLPREGPGAMHGMDK